MTSFGINNEGQLVFDYYHEDTDTLDNANVYNGQNSTLWVNFREAFADEIKETYQNLRNNDRISYDKLVDRFITNGSDKWSESIYNEDSDFKYISMLRSDNDASNLPQVRGSGEEHFRYFIENRLNYCDSKWYASDYANDYVSLRIYTPTTWAGVEPNASITLTPYSNMYAGVRYKANGTLYQERVDHGVPVTFSPQGESFESENNETFNDTETAVYGASQISSLGDLAPLYCGSVNVSKANKLIELKVGDATEGYSNTNLKELSVGTNKLLKKIDVRNCPNFASVLDLSNCPAIEEVYAEGTAITGVNFPESGTLKIAHLPATLANFTLKNQIYVEDLTIAGYDAIKTLWVEGCPDVDGFDILSKSPNVERLRITDVDLTCDSAAEMLALAARPIGGIDENGTNIDKMWIDGKCHIKALTGDELKTVNEAFPYLTITYDALTSYLTFMSEDGKTQLAKVAVQNGGNGTYTGSTPTKASTAQYTYTFAGWSLTPGGSVNANALKNVEADRTVYAAFTGTLRSYTVRFYNGTTLLQTVTVQYGGTATYTGNTPTNNSTGNTADFQFYGWSPSPTNIQKDTDCYAQYNDLREITDSWATIKANADSGTALTKYGVGAFKTLDIGAKTLPNKILNSNYRHAVIVYKDEIHLLHGNGSTYTKLHYKWDGSEWTKLSDPPVYPDGSSTVVYNNELHLLGCTHDAYGTQHYKWDGTTWTSVSTLPFALTDARAVVYNNEIHIFKLTNHYKWDGSSWTEASTLPYKFNQGQVISYNNELHMMGSMTTDYGKHHYKYDGSSWVSVGTLPYNYAKGSAVVYNDELHIFSTGYGHTNGMQHYKYNGSEWTEVGKLPYGSSFCAAVVYNNEIYLVGGISRSDTEFYYYSSETSKWSKVGVTDSIPMQLVAFNHDDLPDGVGKWESLGQLPYDFYQAHVVLLNNEIHILGGTSVYKTAHYKWDGSTWRSVSTLPYSFSRGSAVVCNNEIHILGSNNGSYYKAHYKWNGTSWTSISMLPYDFYEGCAAVYNNEIHIFGGGSTQQGHYKWNGSEWISVDTIPNICYMSSCVILNNEIHLLGGNSSTMHLKWDGSNWTNIGSTVGFLPYQFNRSSAVVFNNEIHILGAYSSSYRKYHYKFDGSSWTSVSTLPYDLCYNGALVYNDQITILGGYNTSSNGKCFMAFNTTNPKATLTFIAKNLLSEARVMDDASPYKAGWSETSIRTWLNGEFLATLPSDLQTAITEVKKISDEGYGGKGALSYTNDKCFIPSITEVVGDEFINTYLGTDALVGQGSIYPVFTDNTSRIRKTVAGTKASIWWTRSTEKYNGKYYSVSSIGNVNNNGTQNGTEASYILIGFCI